VITCDICGKQYKYYRWYIRHHNFKHNKLYMRTKNPMYWEEGFRYTKPFVPMKLRCGSATKLFQLGNI